MSATTDTGSQKKRHFSLITNPEFEPSLMSFATWTIVIAAVHTLEERNKFLFHVSTLFALAITSMWLYRGRFNFGRAEPRGHFDPTGLMALEPKTGDVALWDPPTIVERNKVELLEDKLLAEELTKEFEQGFDDFAKAEGKGPVSKPATGPGPKSELSVESKDKKGTPVRVQSPEEETSTSDRQSSGDSSLRSEKRKDFRARQAKHYANEFRIAQRLKEEMKRKEAARAAADSKKPKSVVSNIKVEESKSEEEEALAPPPQPPDVEPAKDFNTRQQKHYKNEHLKAKQKMEELLKNDPEMAKYFSGIKTPSEQKKKAGSPPDKNAKKPDKKS